MTNEDGDLLFDAIEIERLRNRMLRKASTFRHAVVDNRTGDLISVMRDHETAYDYVDYLMTVGIDAAVFGSVF